MLSLLPLQSNASAAVHGLSSGPVPLSNVICKALGQILVVGETASSDEKLIPAAKPIMEVGAKILLIPRRILIRFSAAG